jgi:hypothetical protein
VRVRVQRLRPVRLRERAGRRRCQTPRKPLLVLSPVRLRALLLVPTLPARAQRLARAQLLLG